MRSIPETDARRKSGNKVVAAIARELCSFLWGNLQESVLPEPGTLSKNKTSLPEDAETYQNPSKA